MTELMLQKKNPTARKIIKKTKKIRMAAVKNQMIPKVNIRLKHPA